MATDAKTEMTETELLHFYLGLRLERGKRDGTLDEVLAEFSEYLCQRDKVRALIQEAEESSARGESRSLDFDAFWQRMDTKFDADGIPE